MSRTRRPPPIGEDRRTRRVILWTAASVLAGVAAWALLHTKSEPVSGDPRQGGSATVSGARDALAGRPYVATDAAPAAGAVSGGVRVAPIDPALRGTGGLRLRVVRATDGAGVADASVVLHGTGHGSEIVRVAARTDADGRVDLAEVPAGAWLTLQVRAPGEAPVVRADVDVVRDQALDLGEIRVGARRSLRVSVIDEGTLPVSGARVLAHPLNTEQRDALEWNAAERRGGEVPDASFAAWTDAEGFATLAGIPPGSCLVTAADGVRVPARMVIEVPAGADPVLPALILRAGVAVGGRVVGPDGSPVVGAQVTAAWGRGYRYGLPLLATTNDQGGFRLLLPPSGVPCQLVIEAEGRPQTRVNVEAAREDLRVEMPDGATLDLSAADATTGKPLADARVEIAVGHRHDDADAEAWRWQGRTDREGRLRTWLPAGRVTALTVDPPYYCIGTASTRDETGVFEPLAAPEEVVAGTTIRVEARLHPRAYPSLEGTVRGPDGTPLADVGITDLCHGTWPPQGVVGTDMDGAFRFGRAAVTQDEEAWLVVLAPGWVGRTPWTVVERARDGVLRATVEAIPSTSVRGRIVDEKGRPVPGARVTWDGSLIHGGPDPHATADADGRFVLSDLHSTDRWGLARRARLTVGARGFLLAYTPEFDVPSGRTVDVGDVVIRRGETIAGTVLDPSGAPAAGARVTVHPSFWMNRGPRPEDVFFTIADIQGRFRVEGVSKPTYSLVRVDPRRSGELGAVIECGTDSDGWQRLRVQLAPSVPCEGTVVDAEGRGVAGASVVFLHGERDAWTDTATTDSRGAFRFAGVPLGPAVVGGFKLSGLLEATDASASAAEVRLDLPLRAPRRITLRRVTQEDFEALPTWKHFEDRSIHRMLDEGSVQPPDDRVW